MSDQHAPDVPESAVRSRRRWLLPTAGLGAVLLITVGVAATRFEAERPVSARPAAELAPVPSATASATPAVPTPVPAASVTPTPTPSRTVSASRRPAPTRSTSTPTRRPAATTTSATPRCTPAGVVDVVQVFTYGEVKVAARTDGESTDQLCPGERIRVFWATYRRTADGGASLYRSQVNYLDRSDPTWTMRLVLPGACGDSWYVVAGNWSIPQTLKPGTVPFGDGKLNWETGGSC